MNEKAVQISTSNDASLSAIDTGTTLIAGPSDDVTAIWSSVGGTPSPANPGFFRFRAYHIIQLHVFPRKLICPIACSTNVAVSLSFGSGKSWPINVQDMNLGPETRGSSMCLGAIFDLSMGTNIDPQPGSGTPNWIIGDTFLVCFRCYYLKHPFSQLHASLY